MDDEAESSQAAQRHRDDATSDVRPNDAIDELDGEEDPAQREVRVKERRMEAKRKRVVFLEHLLRELDTLVFIELITLYHLDCSFFWFVVRAVIHSSLLTPLPEMGIHRQNDDHKPYLPAIMICFGFNFVLHLVCHAPSAGEDTRGYLHGGLMIDFIGQKGPSSKWKLAGLDICLLFIQLMMVSVHVKRRVLKKNLATASAGNTATRPTDSESTEAPAGPATGDAAAREQDADAEERGVLRRTDTLSDIGADDNEEEALLPSSEGGHVDALDVLTSGQCVIGDFTLIDTLLQEHDDYSVFRQTQTGAGASSSIPSNTLRQLHSIRMRFGVGGG